jgi:methylenetetrahydrofolate reductase (NADPH)
MMHLTCVNSTKDELASVLTEAKARGIKNILALRGDPPAGAAEWTATEGGFTYSSELVAFLRKLGGFCIGTAGFPEGHIAQKGGKLVDWGFLREKIAEGAHFVITQLFFDNEDFYQFQDFLAKNGVTVPIIPGVLPVSSAKQTKRFTEMCGARLPEPFLKRLDEIGDDDDAATRFGIEYATEQCHALLKSGVQGIHFYTLNKAASTTAIVRNLGLA